uniref:Uncharacterized protein n=1 Tax=Arundo donax TaxID=35708 RepID=A0A0A9CJS4_ARUDO
MPTCQCITLTASYLLVMALRMSWLREKKGASTDTYKNQPSSTI